MVYKAKIKIAAAGSGLIILTLVAFLGNPAFKQPRGPVGAAKAQDQSHFRDKCSSIIVGKDLTADGSVILAHNEDLSNYAAHHYFYAPHATHEAGEMVTTCYGEIPQVPETYAYTGTTIFDIN